MWRVIKWLAGAIIVIILAWLGIWFYAEMRLQQVVEAKLNQINASGVQRVVYDQLITSRSPLVAGLTLVNPELKITFDPSEPPIVASTARISANINLLHPLTLHINLSPRIMINNASTNGVLTFAKTYITETLNPAVWQGNTKNPITSGLASFTGITLLASDGSLEVAQIDKLTLHETLNAKANKDHTALALTQNIQNFRLSPLLVKLFDLPFSGQINSLSASLVLSGPLDWQQIAKQEADIQNGDQRVQFLQQHLYQWALAGGHARGSLDMWVGPSWLRSNFTLGFDKQIQPEGKAEIFVNYLDQFTNALITAYPGLQTWNSQVQAALSPYISSTPQDGKVLRLHIHYGQQSVFVNDQKTGTIPVINWQTLLKSGTLNNATLHTDSGAAL